METISDRLNYSYSGNVPEKWRLDINITVHESYEKKYPIEDVRLYFDYIETKYFDKIEAAMYESTGYEVGISHYIQAATYIPYLSLYVTVDRDEMNDTLLLKIINQITSIL